MPESLYMLEEVIFGRPLARQNKVDYPFRE